MAGKESKAINNSLGSIGPTMAKQSASVRRSVQSINGSIARLAAGYLSLRGAFTVVGAASDAEEGQNKFEQVFKSQTAMAELWVQDVKDVLKRSEVDLRNYMATVQGTFVPMGFARGEARRMSEAVVQVGLDLASLNNIASDDDAIRTLRSGLIGNHEALRVLNINITEAMVSQELFRLGMAKSSRQATEQQRILARWSLVQKQAADAQGDIIRTAKEYANVVKGLRAQLHMLAVEVGNVVKPVWIALGIETTKALEALRPYIPAIAKTVILLAKMAIAMKLARVAVQAYLVAQLLVNNAQAVFLALQGPRGWLILAGAVVAAGAAIKHFRAEHKKAMDQLAASRPDQAQIKADAAAAELAEGGGLKGMAAEKAAKAMVDARADAVKRLGTMFNETRTGAEKLTIKLAEFDNSLHLMGDNLVKFGGIKAWDEWRNRILEGGTGLQAALKAARREWEVMVDPANKIKHIIEDMRDKLPRGEGGMGLGNLEAQLRGNEQLKIDQKRAQAIKDDASRRVSAAGTGAESDAERIKADLITPLQAFEAEAARIKKLYKGGFIDPLTALYEIQKVNKAVAAGDISHKEAQEEIARIRKLRSGGFISEEQARGALTKAQEKMAADLKAIEDDKKQLDDPKNQPAQPAQFAAIAEQGSQDAYTLIVKAMSGTRDRQLAEQKKTTAAVKNVGQQVGAAVGSALGGVLFAPPPVQQEV